jgi:hypothetical protein
MLMYFRFEKSFDEAIVSRAAGSGL